MSLAPPNTMIHDLLNSVEVQENGIKNKGVTNQQTYECISVILLEQLLDTDKKHFSKRLKGLRYVLPPGLWSGPFPLEVAREAKIQKITSFADLKHIFEKYLDKIKEKPMLRFRCFIPVNLSLEGEFSSQITNEIRLNVHHYAEVASILDNPEIVKKCKGAEERHGLYPDFSNFTVFETEIYCRNELYAEDVSRRYVNFVLGLIIFLLKRNSYSIQICGKVGAISDLNYGFCFVFKDHEFLHLENHNEVKDRQEIYNVPSGAVEELKNILWNFQRAKPQIRSTIVDAVEVFHAGVTEKRPGFAFFFFWTCIELLCLKDASLPETKVKQRLGSIYRNKTDLITLELERFYALRNKLVHNAEYSSITEFDRDQLKWYCEKLLQFFLTEMIQFTQSEINDIYDALSLDPEHFKQKKEMMDVAAEMIQITWDPPL